MTITDASLREILKRTRTIAVVGVSANPVRPSYFVARYLGLKGFRVIPVNPGLAGQSLFGETVYASLADIPHDVDMVDIFRKPDAVPALVDEALARWPDLQTIWMQIGVTHAEAAAARAKLWTHFADVPMDRWLAEVQAHYAQTPDGLVIRYDPRLRDAVLDAGAQPVPDLWPLFDALEGLPLALIRGAHSDLLTLQTADEMARRRPDMIRTDVPGRGHVPFLDEPQALAALHVWLEKMQ